MQVLEVQAMISAISIKWPSGVKLVKEDHKERKTKLSLYEPLWIQALESLQLCCEWEFYGVECFCIGIATITKI
jgi:hypothetical protein